MYEKKPLYRKVNTKARGVHHNSGGKAKWDRKAKDRRTKGGSNGSMHGREQRGLDYTPLYKFLLSRIGQDWNVIHSEAVSRLDKQGANEAIYTIVAQNELYQRST